MTRLTTAGLLAAGLMTAPAAAQPLTRAEAVSRAVAANPQVKLSLEQVAMLDGQIVQARADALPEITWSSVGLRSRDPGLLNSPNFDQFPDEFRTALNPIPANAFATSADLRQTLFSFKLGKALDAARTAREAAALDVERARHATALDAIRAYNQLLFALEQERVIRANVDARERHLESARNRLAAGVATELEVLRADVDLENQRAELQRAGNDVAAARAILNTVMLRPTGTPIAPADTLAVVPFTVAFEEAVREAIAARPELESLRLQEEVRDDLIGVAAADGKPRFDLAASYGFSVRRPRNLFDLDYTRWSATVTVKVPIFDGWRVSGAVAQARAQRNSVTHQIAALENQIRLEVQSAWDALALVDRTIQAAELNVTQARRAFEMTEANYGLGAATPLDVIDAQQALREAENIRNQALYSHANARATLQYVMGREPN
ncbi:MAG: TolC family protein [Acidobacteria bacterium]|nr:TolC family protein [Acidobacteriota bacterium]